MLSVCPAPVTVSVQFPGAFGVTVKFGDVPLIETIDVGVGLDVGAGLAGLDVGAGLGVGAGRAQFEASTEKVGEPFTCVSARVCADAAPMFPKSNDEGFAAIAPGDPVGDGVGVDVFTGAGAGAANG
jgi:hypothetical protein